MLSETQLTLETMVNALRAAGEPTRLRLLVLLSKSDLTVTELIEILGQSQPRISRHLRLLTEARLVERYQEGAWAYFRCVEDGPIAGILSRLLAGIDMQDALFQRDAERMDAVRQQRAAAAKAYFDRNAAHWDALRSLHVEESRVEAAMQELVGSRPFQAMLDLGTGTGRMLELFAPQFTRAVGIDASRDMLAYARAKLDAAGLARVQVRQADIYMLPTATDQFDLVTVHQVLHFLEDPASAIREAARALAPAGRLLVVDFAPHALKFLQEEHLHRRLGFSHEQVSDWLEDAGLEVVNIVDLKPEDSRPNGEKLTVTLWLARDPRMLIASQTSHTELANKGDLA